LPRQWAGAATQRQESIVRADDIRDDAVEAADRPAEETADRDVRVGRRIRAIRLERNLSLADVAERTGISIGALSQIERGLSSLRVRTLWPLAAALDVEPHGLIADGDEAAGDMYVVRAQNRKPAPVWSEGIRKDLLSPPGATLTGLLVVIEPDGGTAESYAHPGHEFGLVLSGEVDLTIDGVVYRLRAGDSFAFKSRLRHGFRNPSEAPCEIVWVNTVKPSEVRNGA
jgi:transcriptional regulator with XRE-family HTH domain